jgi:hypothetical protein
MALAVALPVLPAVAAEADEETEPARNAVAEVSDEPAATAEPRQAIERLQGLRLHPGQDGLDVAETARRRPRSRE